jgi:hypothetical protein
MVDNPQLHVVGATICAKHLAVDCTVAIAHFEMFMGDIGRYNVVLVYTKRDLVSV